jgi:LmbE family N-acetylglucosaminyl deacetylase
MVEGLSPHAVSEVYFFASSQPDTWIDIEPTLPLKLKALRCHASQIKNPRMMEQMVRTWFGVWGREKGFAYAERFRRLEIFQNPGERLKRLKETLK